MVIYHRKIRLKKNNTSIQKNKSISSCLMAKEQKVGMLWQKAGFDPIMTLKHLELVREEKPPCHLSTGSEKFESYESWAYTVLLMKTSYSTCGI